MSSGETAEGWDFLRSFVESAAACIFSRQQYTPDWLPADRVRVVPPSIDPFSAKNVDMADDDAARMLLRAGLLAGRDRQDAPDAEPRMRRYQGLLLDDDAPPETRATRASGQPLGPAQGHDWHADRLR